MTPTRRRVLLTLAALAACRTSSDTVFDSTAPPQLDWMPEAVRANLEAVMDVLLPATADAPGAVEAGALTVLSLDNVVPLARSQGFLGELPPWLDDSARVLDPVSQALISAELDRMAAEQSLFTAFRDLSRVERERAVADAFVDPDRYLLMELLRGVAMLAWLGAMTSDAGLRHLGFPAFEDFDDRLAVSGYPRVVDGIVDDYTYNRAPEPTPGDDLTLVIDGDGDLF